MCITNYCEIRIFEDTELTMIENLLSTGAGAILTSFSASFILVSTQDEEIIKL